jgi:hypothetical protein
VFVIGKLAGIAFESNLIQGDIPVILGTVYSQDIRRQNLRDKQTGDKSLQAVEDAIRVHLGLAK